MSTLFETFNTKMTALANSIRSKSGATGTLTLDTMKTAVDGISTGITPTGNKAITASTSTQSNIDVTNYATVSVAPTPTETKTATSNGTVIPTSGKYLSSVTVNIPTYDGSVS